MVSLEAAGAKSGPADSWRALATLPSTSGLLLISALAVALAARGGFFETGRWAVGLLLAGSASAAVASGAVSVRSLRSPVIAGLGLLAVWALARGALAGDVGSAFGTVGLLGAVAVCFLVVRAEPAPARAGVVMVLIGLGAAVALSGWLGLVLRWEPLALPSPGVWRATTLITYANASAALLVVLTLVGIGRLAGRPSRVTAVAVTLLIIGSAATLSRAGALAAAVGLTVLTIRLGLDRLITALGPPLTGAVVAVAGLLPSLPRSLSPRPGIAAIALLLGLLIAVALTRIPGRTVARLAIPASLITIGVTFAVLGLTTDAADDFALRLTPAGRAEVNQVALTVFNEAPLVGVGPGPLWLTWSDPSGRAVGTWFVHNEYLQLLVQFGAIGGLLFAGLVAATARTVRPGRTPTLAPEAWAGIAGALLALAVHSAFDFLWHIPAIPMVGAVLVGVASPSEQEERTCMGE